MAIEAPPAPAPPAAAAPAPTPAAQPNLMEPVQDSVSAPKPGSARERMQKETAKKWEGETTPPARPGAREDKPVVPPKPSDKKPEDGKKPAEQGETTTHEPPPEVTPEQKKQNPWKLYRGEKERADKLERQMAEAKKESLAETERSQYLERIEKSEAKVKTYEDEIRFKSYEKSDEFRTKYEEPYEKAWSKHMKDLQEVSITGDDGVVREVKAQDLLDLCHLKLPDAKKLAVEKWGDFANEAMMARRDINELFAAKTEALEEARKTGADREKTFQENAARWRADVQKHIKETWEAANQQALSDPVNGEFFKPVDDDPKRNEILTKGFAQVDRAFAKNPWDQKLTPEERAQAVREHAAIRNRSASFGVQKYIIARMRKEIAELKKENDGYKGSQPSTAGGTATASAGAPTSGGRAKMYGAQEKWAK